MMLYICENKTPKPLKPMKIKNESKILFYKMLKGKGDFMK